MVALVVLLLVVAAIGGLMWTAVGSPPTRPRPDSRYRGATYMSVHRRLQRRRSHQRGTATRGTDEPR